MGRWELGMEAGEPSKPRDITRGICKQHPWSTLVETGPTATGCLVAALLCYLATSNRLAVHARSKLITVFLINIAPF